MGVRSSVRTSPAAKVRPVRRPARSKELPAATRPNPAYLFPPLLLIVDHADGRPSRTIEIGDPRAVVAAAIMAADPTTRAYAAEQGPVELTIPDGEPLYQIFHIAPDGRRSAYERPMGAVEARSAVRAFNAVAFRKAIGHAEAHEIDRASLQLTGRVASADELAIVAGGRKSIAKGGAK